MRNEEKTCESCEVWVFVKNQTPPRQDYGQCRLKPPVVVADPDAGPGTCWPITHSTEWCGSWTDSDD